MRIAVIVGVDSSGARLSRGDARRVRAEVAHGIEDRHARRILHPMSGERSPPSKRSPMAGDRIDGVASTAERPPRPGVRPTATASHDARSRGGDSRPAAGHPHRRQEPSVRRHLDIRARAAGTRTQFTIIEDGRIENPFLRCLARFFMGYRATMDEYLANLKRASKRPEAAPGRATLIQRFEKAMEPGDVVVGAVEGERYRHGAPTIRLRSMGPMKRLSLLLSRLSPSTQ